MNQLPQPDPRGVLVFDALPADLQNAEDATAAADHERASVDCDRYTGPILHTERPATPTERLLLAHLGFTIPTQLTTIVSYYSPAVRTRSWPQLGGRP